MGSDSVSDDATDSPGDGTADTQAGRAMGELVAQVEDHLLGGDRTLSRHEVADQSGLSMDEARTLWRALGFAAVDDQSRIFGDADVAALRDVDALRQLGGFDEDDLLAMTRIIGQAFARLASWQGQLTLEIIGRRPELLSASRDDTVGPGAGDGEGVGALMGELTPLVERLHQYVWRRQLAAFYARAAGGAGAQDGSAEVRSNVRMAVGFVDMAAFTALTRRSSEQDLRRVLGAFESLATDVVGANHGQVVKMIGDEVLFVADDPEAAAEIALALIEAGGGDVPALRAGVAFGEVVSRLGDVFGQTVNIASRLTAVARPESVLIDQGMADALSGSPSGPGSSAAQRYSVRSLRPVSVRGYQHLRAHRLRRAT